jgi:hypothetical protein
MGSFRRISVRLDSDTVTTAAHALAQPAHSLRLRAFAAQPSQSFAKRTVIFPGWDCHRCDTVQRYDQWHADTEQFRLRRSATSRPGIPENVDTARWRAGSVEPAYVTTKCRQLKRNVVLATTAKLSGESIRIEETYSHAFSTRQCWSARAGVGDDLLMGHIYRWRPRSASSNFFSGSASFHHTEL